MAHKPWKDLERRAAKFFGGVRLWRPDYGDSAPDGESDTHVWDAKYKQHGHAIVRRFLDCEFKYAAYADGRRFVLYLFNGSHPKQGDFILVRAKDYGELLDKAGER
jgi:hypothetical protein